MPSDCRRVAISFDVYAWGVSHERHVCHNVGTALAKFSHRFAYTVTWLDVPRPDGAV